MILIGMVISLPNLNAQEDSDVPTLLNEVSFGLGAAHSFEKNMFNVPSDAEGGTNLSFIISYFRHLDNHWAIGINTYGFMKTVDDVLLNIGGINKMSELDVTVLNLSAVGKYIFSRGSVEPYCLALIAYTGGTLHEDELGTLGLNGISVGGGAGVSFLLNESITISLEGIASFGTAEWKERPFYNSSGIDFDPAMAVGFVQVSYRFGL